MLHIPEAHFRTEDNVREIYKFYTDFQVDPEFAKKIHHVSNAVIKPTISVEPGVGEQVRDHVAQGGQVIWAQTHNSNWNPFQVAAAANEIDWMEDMLGRIFIFGKQDFFTGKNPYKLSTRWLFTNVGAIPVPRIEDEYLKGLANGLALDTGEHRMIEHGQHMSIFPSGRRVKETPWLVPESDDLKSGVARVALAAIDAGRDPIILPTGIWEGDGNKRDPRHCAMHIGEIIIPGPTTKAIMNDLHNGLQPALDEAIDRSGGITFQY